MKTRPFLFLATILFLFVLGIPAKALALSCVAPKAKDELKRATWVFVGTAEKVIAPADPRPDGTILAIAKTTFRVKKVYKGELKEGQLFEVDVNVYWGAAFQKGDNVIVFAQKRDERPFIEACSGTSQVNSEMGKSLLEDLEKIMGQRTP